MTAPGPVSATSVAASPSAGPAEHLGDAEVEELAEVVPGHHDVLGLDVPVDDTGGVRVHEGLEKRRRQRKRLRKRQRPGPEPVAQRLARDELHREKRDAVRLPGLEERGDRGMLQPGARLGLPDEPGPRFGRQRLRQHLDGRHTAEREIAGEEDLAHPSGPQALLDAIVREGATDQSVPSARSIISSPGGIQSRHLTLSAGSRLGPYEILAPIGAGGMGEVYRAKDAKLGREIAVKVLPSATASDPDRRQRFEMEARSASALNHPNILTIYDIGEADGTVYIAMELVEGRTLRELVASGEPVPTKKLLDVAVQTAEGLAKAHSAGIVHRDLKPENIMISKDGFAKILDFGLAKLTEAPSQDESVVPTAIAAPTQPGTVMGTAGYMSPEQASGQPVDFHSDQFTLGTILYEMATGQRAFQRKTGAETLVAIIREEPEPLSQLAPKAPAPVRWIVERLLAKDPEERYASTKDLARDLKSVRDHLTETSFSGGLEAAEPREASATRWVLPRSLALARWNRGGLSRARSAASRQADRSSELKQLTFARGSIRAARFAPDGQTIVYGAAWDGRPLEIFTTRADSTESRSLGLPDADLLAVSSTGELAISLHRHFIIGYETTGTLARVPLAGGAPREVLENVEDADWSPDGRESRRVTAASATASRLEYPIGKVLFESCGLGQQRPRLAGRPARRLRRPSAERRQRRQPPDRRHERQGASERPVFAHRRDRLVAGGRRNLVGGDSSATSDDGKNARLGLARRSTSDIARDGRVLLLVTAARREIVGISKGDAASAT